VYFYETEKISFTAEGRPDAAQPVSANLGIKQRVVVVVPPGDKEACKARALPVESRRDAVGMISYFNFTKKPGEKWFSDQITIDTVLVTGEAAKCLDGAEAKQLFGTLGQLAGESKTTAIATISLAYEGLKKLEKQENQGAKEYVAKLDALYYLAPEVYLFDLYAEGDNGLTVAFGKGTEVGKKDFNRVIVYWDNLQQNVKLLTKSLKQDSLAVDGNPVKLQRAMELNKELQRISNELGSLEQRIRSQPIIVNTVSEYGRLLTQ
jgi:hypothetical protein